MTFWWHCTLYYGNVITVHQEERCLTNVKYLIIGIKTS